ncbi:MAG: FAD:protein FMN transferase [bacterium]|nr:FAD:protein FMN transferase [bacterium]
MSSRLTSRPASRATALLALLLASATGAQDTLGAAPERVERVLASMGTTAHVRVDATTRGAAVAASEAAVRALESAERRLSTWSDTSELARLNTTPVGARFELSPTLRAELSLALEISRSTGGAFDPTVGALVRAWNLRGGGRVPAAGELTQARENTGLALLQLDARTATRAAAGLSVEEGGFGKGAGLDAAFAALRDTGALRAEIDLGGQLLLFDAADQPRPFETFLAHPRTRDLPIASLRLAPGSLATSGNSERGVVVDGVRLGHLLDPATGRFAEDFGSTTVFTMGALRADALSTALYVMGPERALAWASEHDGVEVLVALAPVGATEGVRLLASAGWRERIDVLRADVHLEFVPEED